MQVAEIKHDVIANNLANVNTNGFKREEVPFESFSAILGQAMAGDTGENSSSFSTDVYTVFEQGMVTRTGNRFDVAINGKGFFSVTDENGQTRYTRDGALTLNADGIVVNNSGYALLGGGGEITVPPAASDKLHIDRDGNVYADGELLDKLKVTDFADSAQLTKVGKNLFSASENAAPVDAEGYSIEQMALEKSNVNLVDEMVEMVVNSRQDEVAQKMIQAQDETLENLISQVGNTK